MNRRRFLRWSARAVLASPLAAVAYGWCEASWFHVRADTIAVPRLPSAFDGLRIALLTDLHHSRFTGLGYIRRIVETANGLGADLIALGGDFAYKYARYIPPCLEVLADLHAPLGVYAILGNHDHWYDPKLTHRCIAAAKIADLTNTGVWLERGGQRLRLGGVDDFWEGTQDLWSALDSADTSVILCHNPDYVEMVRDRRVGLVLSGHTHGGQICLPVVGAPFVPSRYGSKYLHGLVRTPYTQVFVSRGLATTGPPLRIGSPPEINLLTLVPAPETPTNAR